MTFIRSVLKNTQMLFKSYQSYIDMSSIWFRRLVKDCKRISPHVRIKRIKMGFYRIYFKRAYIHEVYSEMPLIGHDIEEKDIFLESKKYYEEYEDRAELTRKIKNYVEGYWDALDRIRTAVYMIKHDHEYAKMAVQKYSTVVIR